MKSKKQVFNPYLPSWEYIPDGEPHVFGDRVYVYGSHDRFNGFAYCLNDYVCYSAPVSDLSDWKYEGVIYKKTDDPFNPDGRMCLYAPDVVQGADGRYYIYYVLDKVSCVSVAVSDSPAGKYEFYGYVKDSEGRRLGDRENDQPQFDPAVLMEGDKVYLYTGFCGQNDYSRKGAMATVLGPDMLTIIEETRIIVPGNCYSSGTEFEEHEFFEGPSIRKHKDMYYFVYSSSKMHELCYAVSKYPTKDFKYGGAIVSNCNENITTGKPSELHTYIPGNNHGGMVEVQGQWYIFYHRHTNGTNFCRQGCAEPIYINDDGSISQVEMTSCGLNGTPLVGKGEYPAYIACNLFSKTMDNNHLLHYAGWIDGRYARITQDGRDGDEEIGYIANMQDSTIAGFKYFECDGITKISLKTRGYGNGYFEVKTAWDGETLGKVPVGYSNIWVVNSANISVPNGVQALYFEFKGEGGISLASFILE